jgi:ubiquinone/menaquinone biosynthesis C-methylase UbiE
MARECEAWYDSYASPTAIRARMPKFRRKLSRLGLMEALAQGPTLDVACGFGEALDLLYEVGRRELVGVDVHDRPLAGAPTRYRYLMASATALPFADASFANVLCFHSLHHFDSVAAIEAFLREATRVLRPGGLLALIDHYDSFQLRSALRLILTGVFDWLPGMREMRRQLALEHDQMRAFFTSWSVVQSAIDRCGLEREFFTRDLFFFYWRGRKAD